MKVYFLGSIVDKKNNVNVYYTWYKPFLETQQSKKKEYKLLCLCRRLAMDTKNSLKRWVELLIEETLRKKYQTDVFAILINSNAISNMLPFISYWLKRSEIFVIL